MLLLFPVLAFLPTLIYLAAALLPAIILLRYVYRHDTVEPEPKGLLVSLLVMGCLSALCSGVLEAVADAFLSVAVEPGSRLYTVLLAFLVVAVVEEGTKLIFLKLRSWNHPAFNYRFDGVVYAVFVSLGFAALENVQYVNNYGLSVALPRALLAIPGHLSFSIYMGMYYGRARLQANLGDREGARRSLRTGYLIAVFLHGFYDTCAMLQSGLSTIVFLVFVILMFANAYRTLKRESATDTPITPPDEGPNGPPVIPL
ncbi:MAG: PrsW family intramembrane metalloprotease [Oscillospiraceae bacterium]|nr:PrsW family intramembrane metalloprotease [Oscillospiraceae bacterium]